MNKKVLVAVCILALLLFKCVSNIGGVENGNPIVTGYVHNEQGEAVKNAIIKLIPYNNNPLFNNTITATTSSDEKGKYCFKTVNDGRYNIIGETTDDSLSFIDSITVKGESTIIANNIIKMPGMFKGVIKLQPYMQGIVHIVLLGTNIYTVTMDTIGNFVCPMVPEGTYRAAVISTLPEYSDTQITIDIVPVTITTIDTITLSYRENGPLPLDSALLRQLKKCSENLPGTYTGTVTTPWAPRYDIAFIIDSTGHYSAYNTTTADVPAIDPAVIDSIDNPSIYPLTADLPALYYGIDSDDPRKKIALANIQANGGISGSIQVWWGPRLFEYGPSSFILKEISELRFNSMFDTLTFQMWNTVQSDPVQISLHRIQADSLPRRPFQRPKILIDSFHDTVRSDQVYLDSIKITITSVDSLPIIYQFVNYPKDGILFFYENFPADNRLWRDDLPSQTYTGPFIVNRKGTDQVILAKVKAADISGRIMGQRFTLQ
jgi:hypothetical protein